MDAVHDDEEDFVFQRKSKAEQVGNEAVAAKDKAVAGVRSGAGAAKDAFDAKVAPKANEAAGAAADAAHQARDKSAEFAHQAREKGAEFAHQAREKATQAQKRAVSGIDHGIDTAVPKGQDAIAGLTPKVDHARDVIVDDILPRISELLGQVQTVKDEKLAQTVAALGAAPAVVAAAPKKKRKGGVLLVVGVLAATGAAVAWYLNSMKKPATDPWATDHHVGGAPGVDTQVRATLADKATATGKPASGVGTTGASTAKDTPIADSLSSKAGSGSDVTKDSTTDAVDGVKDTAADAGETAEEISGGSGTDASGFGTDFGDAKATAGDTATTAGQATEDTAEDVKDTADRKTDLP